MTIAVSRIRSLFRMADGTYGVISVRTNRGTATGDSTAKSSVLIATSEDLLTYSEQENSGSIVDLGETNGVNAPYAVYDTASKQYVVGWADDNGVAKYTTFDSLKGSTSKHGSVLYGSVAKSGVLAADGVQGHRELPLRCHHRGGRGHGEGAQHPLRPL